MAYTGAEKPDYTRARPGHRAVSIRIDCVLVFKSSADVFAFAAFLFIFCCLLYFILLEHYVSYIVSYIVLN